MTRPGEQAWSPPPPSYHTVEGEQPQYQPRGYQPRQQQRPQAYSQPQPQRQPPGSTPLPNSRNHEQPFVGTTTRLVPGMPPAPAYGAIAIPVQTELTKAPFYRRSPLHTVLTIVVFLLGLHLLIDHTRLLMTPFGAYWTNLAPAENCTGVGTREYSAVLVDIPSSWDWQHACRAMKITIHGRKLHTPGACERVGDDTVGRWTVDWDQSDCIPAWAEPSADKCVDYGTRKWTADLAYLPSGIDNFVACQNTPLNFHGSPTREFPTGCIKDHESGRMTGTWYVNHNEPGCTPWWRWSDWDSGQCHAYGLRAFSAKLTDVPEELDCIETCMQVPILLRAGVRRTPDSCDIREERGKEVVMGHWMVNEGIPECTPFLKDFWDGGCIESGIRRVEATADGIGRHEDWYKMCTTIPLYWGGKKFLPVQCQARQYWFKHWTTAVFNIPDWRC